MPSLDQHHKDSCPTAVTAAAHSGLNSPCVRVRNEYPSRSGLSFAVLRYSTPTAVYPHLRPSPVDKACFRLIESRLRSDQRSQWRRDLFEEPRTNVSVSSDLRAQREKQSQQHVRIRCCARTLQASTRKHGEQGLRVRRRKRRAMEASTSLDPRDGLRQDKDTASDKLKV